MCPKKKHAPKMLEATPSVRDMRRFFCQIIERDGHWLWQGHKDKDGYGQFWFQRRAHWAHRVSFALFNGPIPDGMSINHKRTCLNPSCVNPRCLELLTVSENSIERNERYACVSTETEDDSEVDYPH